ncbi:MAG: efflux RND transporter permease subunit [Gemmataceae bacterium]
MKSVIRWAINNSPALNTLMIAGLILGLMSIYKLQREVFPEFELEIVLVSVPYPGATPEECEEGICQKIEEYVRPLDGIKKMTSVAKEGLGSVVLELEVGKDPQKILNEVRSEVDRIPSFPKDAEDPEVKQITFRTDAIQIGVIAPISSDPQAEKKLREVGEKIRDDLIRLDNVSQAELVGVKQYEISVEASPKTLKKYGLTLEMIGARIARYNRDLPGGNIRTPAGTILVKGESKGLTGEDIKKIPIVTDRNKVTLTIGDICTVRDDFVDEPMMNLIKGRPGITIEVTRTSKEDLLVLAREVRAYIKEKNEKNDLPPGYELTFWGDRSVDVEERMNLLSSNGLQGLVLVLFTLALFLDTRLAFWVALGIPISILGACVVLWYFDQTLNMLSMFAFLMALGIVVDDAIVVGENIYAHRELGKSYFKAALDGTYEVLPSVATSVTTTVIAFMPLFFVTGVMGKFIAVMPLAMVAMLVISLLESFTLLPCHLAHGETNMSQSILNWYSRLPLIGKIFLGSGAVALFFTLTFLLYPLRRVEKGFRWLSVQANTGLNWFIQTVYLRSLRFTLANPGTILAAAVAVLMLSFALIRGGWVPFIVFPKLDSKTIQASITFPDKTHESITKAATQKIEDAIDQVNNEYMDEFGTSLILLKRRTVGFVKAQGPAGQAGDATGGHVGLVVIELVDTAERLWKSDKILKRWRELCGNFPGAESVKFDNATLGPGGTPIEFRLLAPASKYEALKKAVAKTKQKLQSYAGVFDVADDATPGKPELRVRVKANAKSLQNVTQENIDRTIRATYQGYEVQRLQRGRHEVKVQVRYPRETRRSIAAFDRIPVQAGETEYELRDLGETVLKDDIPSEYNRIDQLRAIKISADVDELVTNAKFVVDDLRGGFMKDLMEEFPGLRVRWEGQQEQTVESIQSLILGLAIALVAMFVVLTLEFNSYFQPIIIMAIIPFGLVGAVLGHAVMGLAFTLFSLFGLVALTGVVVNDSIVLIDFINHRVRDGMPVSEALLDAGRRRFRPVLLTSVTTVAGLLPLMLEKSFQAQLLIPMAVSLCFGLMMTTILVLFLIPTFYMICASVGIRPPQKHHEDEDEAKAFSDDEVSLDHSGNGSLDETKKDVAPPSLHEDKTGNGTHEAASHPGFVSEEVSRKS